MIGQAVSHYKILEKLGEGGMGVVYKAQDTRLDRLVALKFLPEHLFDDPSAKARFIQEAKGASAINHQNIAAVYDIDEVNGRSFIAMEYLEGKTLKQLTKEGLKLNQVLDIAIQAGEGLAAAHKKEIVHRDIKSDNIMLTKDNVAKIMDFGLAKLKGAPKLTESGSTLGTVAYMSPEQTRGEAIDQRSDIFSFGVVLYELLTGRLPFAGEHREAISYSILFGEPDPLARYKAGISDGLQRAVSKALTKNKEERYQHIDELVADLKKEKKGIESGQRILPKSKKWLPILVPAGIGLAVLVFLVFKPLQIKIGSGGEAVAEQNSLAVMYFENIPDPEDKDHTGEMLTNLLITSLSQLKGWEVISRQRLYDIQADMGKPDEKKITPSLASKIAQRAGVRTMLLGTVLQSQPKLAVTSQLIEVKSGKILSSQRLTGFSADQIFPFVDSLAVLVRGNLNVSTSAAAEAKPVAKVTTSSPEAYRSYLVGVELAQKLYSSEANAAQERAIELDSNFAMAYFQLAQNFFYLGDNAGRIKALQKAWQLREGVSEKERLQIEAEYADGIDHDLFKAAEILEKLLQKYPHEQGAYLTLEFVYLHLLKFERVIQTSMKALKSDSLDKTSWNVMAYGYACLNKRKEALEAVDRYLKLAPGEPNPYDSKAEIYFMFGELDSATYWYQNAVELRPDFNNSSEKLGFNAVLQGDYSNAEKYFRQFGSTADKSQRAQSEFDFLLISLHRGEFAEAQRHLVSNLSLYQTEKLQNHINLNYFTLALIAYEKADYPAMLTYARRFSAEKRKDPDDKIYGRDALALACLKSGNRKLAYEIMHELAKDIRGKLPLWQVSHDYTLGLLSFEERKYELALEQFKKALQPLFPNRSAQFHYALALLKTGHLDEAIDELGRVTWWTPISNNTLGYDFLSPWGYWPIASVKAHYWLGVAYEQKGDVGAAKKEYEKFLEIWKDADFNSPELADAKGRLARLKGKV